MRLYKPFVNLALLNLEEKYYLLRVVFAVEEGQTVQSIQHGWGDQANENEADFYPVSIIVSDQTTIQNGPATPILETQIKIPEDYSVLQKIRVAICYTSYDETESTDPDEFEVDFKDADN